MRKGGDDEGEKEEARDNLDQGDGVLHCSGMV
jgi:hypothetical protein